MVIGFPKVTDIVPRRGNQESARSNGGNQESLIWFGAIAVAVNAVGVVVCCGLVVVLDDEILVPSEFIE